ncbi:MAG: SagB/ThcOx family dehydrogenase [Bacteroides sp.]|jgi:SagB-type dehydrogenase family enzyme|nr:SagB/ThcOx family dehydrogenase [Bacteroides sp.]
MKKLFVYCVLLMTCLGLSAQELPSIKLNPPDTQRGLPVMQALKLRSSTTGFSSIALSQQDLADIIWAANGVNRPDDGKRTAPSARNSQDVDVYVVMESGAFLYNHHEHALVPVAIGDHRQLVSGRQTNMANAPLMLVLVSDFSRFSGNNEELKLRWGAMDAGIVSQNIAVACAGLGLVTRPRASMDVEGLKKLLKLTETQHLMLNNPVGYPAN